MRSTSLYQSSMAASSSSLVMSPTDTSLPEEGDDGQEDELSLYRRDTIKSNLTPLSSSYQRSSPLARTSSQRRISMELHLAANNNIPSSSSISFHPNIRNFSRSPQLSEDCNKTPLASTPTRNMPASNRRQYSSNRGAASSSTLTANLDYFSADVDSTDSPKVPFPSSISLQSVRHNLDSPSSRRIARHVSLTSTGTSAEISKSRLGPPPLGAVDPGSTPSRPNYRHMRYSTDFHVNNRSQGGATSRSDATIEDRTVGSRIYSDITSTYTNTLGSYTNEEGGSALSGAIRMAREHFKSEQTPSRHKLVVVEEGKLDVTFQMGNCIGRGQFGSVYRALNLKTGQMVAVKRIKVEGLSEEEVTQLMGEVDLLKSLSHPSVVKYEGLVRDPEVVSIILEFVENGSLSHTLKAFGNFPEKLVASYVVKILEGLNYLHDMNVVHCDLKAANILTTKNGNVKLSDFGVSLNLKAVKKIKNDAIGTPNWMAPEVIELKGVSTAADIWSLGCTIIELLTGKPPYGDMLAMSALWRIVEDDCPPFPDRISASLQDFLTLCFQKDPLLRPSAEQLFEHEWLRKTWTGHQELRLQDSVPFLRRISADARRMDARDLHKAIKTQQVKEESNQQMERSSSSPPDSLMTRPDLISLRAASAPHSSWSLQQQVPSLMAESSLSFSSSEQTSPLTPSAIPMTSSPPVMSLVDLSMRRSSDPAAGPIDLVSISKRSSLMHQGMLPLAEPAFLDLNSSESFSIEETNKTHAFVKITFSKAVLCKICRDPVKKHAVLCEECGLICHASCTKKAISACNLRTQLLMYANQAIYSRSSMDLARATSPTPVQMQNVGGATSPSLSSDQSTPPLTPRVFKLPFVRLKRNSSVVPKSPRSASASPPTSSSPLSDGNRAVAIAIPVLGPSPVSKNLHSDVLLQSPTTPFMANSPSKVDLSAPSTPLVAAIQSTFEVSTPSSPQRRRRISLLPYLNRHRSPSPTPHSALPMSLSRSMGSGSRDNSLRYVSSISSAASSGLENTNMSKTNSSTSNQLISSSPRNTATPSLENSNKALHRRSIAATSSPQLSFGVFNDQGVLNPEMRAKRLQSAMPQATKTTASPTALSLGKSPITNNTIKMEIKVQHPIGSPPLSMPAKKSRRLSSKQDCIIM